MIHKNFMNQLACFVIINTRYNDREITVKENNFLKCFFIFNVLINTCEFHTEKTRMTRSKKFRFIFVNIRVKEVLTINIFFFDDITINKRNNNFSMTFFIQVISKSCDIWEKITTCAASTNNNDMKTGMRQFEWNRQLKSRCFFHF
ncbi:hypothetical protein D3C80_1574200 [compost metagenome]